MRKYKGYYPMVEISANNDTGYYPYNANYSQNNRQPIYLPSGIQLPDYDGDRNSEEEEIKYMKSMYPDFCKKVQVYVDEECDKLEYDGSYMYDEYPDRDTIEKITDRILDSVKHDERLYKKEIREDEVKEMQYYGYDYERDLIKLLLLNELFNRRRNRFYGGRHRRVRPYYPPSYYNYSQYFD